MTDHTEPQGATEVGPNDPAWDGERCGRCGRGYALWWAADPYLWNEVEGGPSGMRCPDCFWLDCTERGITPYFVAFREHVSVADLLDAFHTQENSR